MVGHAWERRSPERHPQGAPAPLPSPRQRAIPLGGMAPCVSTAPCLPSPILTRHVRSPTCHTCLARRQPPRWRPMQTNPVAERNHEPTPTICPGGDLGPPKTILPVAWCALWAVFAVYCVHGGGPAGAIRGGRGRHCLLRDRHRGGHCGQQVQGRLGRADRVGARRHLVGRCVQPGDCLDPCRKVFGQGSLGRSG